ncbi:MAG TPA: hypothetical protein VFD58_23420 [Blastocatellia bacterium]|nr:hypothetical protein [Blastocatellia bacterium]
MPQTTPHRLTDKETSQPDPDDAGATNAGEEAIGLPDLPGKSRLAEHQLNIPDYPPDEGAPDSMTGAVMENLRVGAGIANSEDEREDEE